MIIDAKKVNILEGSWVDSEYRKYVYPQFQASGTPVFRQSVLPLTRLYDDDYWIQLQSTHRIDIAVPDFRHWLYDDDVFDKYVDRISSVRFPVVCLFECPFGFEMPSQIPVDIFARKLFERTAKLSTAIKDRSKDTIVLSPAISLVNENFQSYYLDYFIHNRQYFDGYAVHCCNDMTEHSLGKLTVLLSQVMEVLGKRLWITKWAVPSCDDKILNARTMGANEWQPYDTDAAKVRLQRSFNLIESVAQSGSNWFYVGVGRDWYSSRRTPGRDEYWNLDFPGVPDYLSYGWRYWHFLGMLTADGKLKSQFVSMFDQLAQQYNA